MTVAIVTVLLKATDSRGPRPLVPIFIIICNRNPWESFPRFPIYFKMIFQNNNFSPHSGRGRMREKLVFSSKISLLCSCFQFKYEIV